ncbi:hypothetical protein P5673_005718 [Acropora cervicornis]|uniref:Uncharacterized protein n=1 Tax=Acropora cervicornis TaxID=6130 RepID=A0AAD9QYI9_ACRCE|nr:hypothetical protein P5673_005718 [Acropora cervicornis]
MLNSEEQEQTLRNDDPDVIKSIKISEYLQRKEEFLPQLHGSVSKRDPFIDIDGVLRVGGRLIFDPTGFGFWRAVCGGQPHCLCDAEKYEV